MQHLFIINPAAGKRGATARLEALLAEVSFPHEVVYTRQAGDARRITLEAAASGQPLRVYACGGDGTLNEVVNGAAGQDHVAVTNVPKGTGNDFLKLFGPDCRALFSDLEALASGPQTAFDLMECGGLLGLDIACVGLDARVAAGVHRFKGLPLVSGKMAYILSLVQTVLFQGISEPMSVRAEGLDWSGEAAILCVCNGRCYGGGFCPVPEAMPDDGVLETLLIPKVSLLTLARLVGQYGKGRYRDYPQYILPSRGSWFQVSSPRTLTAVVDGEVLTDTGFTIRLSEKKVNFFYPAGADYRPGPPPA